MKRKKRVIIFVDGLIEDVWGLPKQYRVDVIDYDTIGVSDDEICHCKETDREHRHNRDAF
jgi:hypothetical protein